MGRRVLRWLTAALLLRLLARVAHAAPGIDDEHQVDDEQEASGSLMPKGMVLVAQDELDYLRSAERILLDTAETIRDLRVETHGPDPELPEGTEAVDRGQLEFMLEQCLANRAAILDVHFEEYFGPEAATRPDVRRGDYAEALAGLNRNVNILRRLLGQQS